MENPEEKARENSLHFSSGHAHLVRQALFALLDDLIEDANDEVCGDPKTLDANRQWFHTGRLAGFREVKRDLEGMLKKVKTEEDDD